MVENTDEDLGNRLQEAHYQIDRLELELEDARKCADLWKQDYDRLEAGLRQIQENYMKRGLIKRLTCQLLTADHDGQGSK